MTIAADYVVVGVGLTGATIARLLVDAGRDVVVIEAQDHVGGNVADARHPSGLRYNLHGPHYFRTSSDAIWDFVRRFATFTPFEARVVCQVGSEFIPWPLQRSTLARFGGAMPEAAGDTPARNFAEAMLRLVPRPVYETFIAGYTAKQWGVVGAALDAALARRIEISEDGDHRLSTSRFQGLPLPGFTAWVEAMLAGIDVRLGVDFHAVQGGITWRRRLIYTGPIDRFFDHAYGPLRYRAQERAHLHLPHIDRLYPCGQVNLPSIDAGRHVRSIEWRHILPQDVATGTLLTLETPVDATDWRQAEYPFPSAEARALYERYRALADARSDVVFCGRLGEYRYLDMDQAIGRAMTVARRILDG